MRLYTAAMSQAEPQGVGQSVATDTRRRARGHAWWQCAALALILIVNVRLKAPNLAHPTLKPMDESFHAVVARNLLYDPFEPTLVRETYLRYTASDWLGNHVWLHKPVLPLWIIALSIKCLGVNALAVRLPSLILSTLAVALTFLIARRLYGPVTGLTAAAIQAIVPAIGMIVQGYVFSDAVDINLLFWSELSLYLMLLRSRRWVWLSGAAAGAAFLSKTFPALFLIAPMLLVAALRAAGRWPAAEHEANAGPEPGSRRTAKGEFASTALGWLIALLLVAAPWNLYCALRYPVEFTTEFGLVLTHLSADVENWASPWDRLWFQHLPTALYLFWTASLVGSVVLTFRAIQLKRWEWLFVPVWIVAVLVPFTLATSKTPTATLIAWPALMIGAGFLIARACEGYVVELAALVTVLIATNFFAGKFITMGWGMTEPLAIMRQAQWIAYHVAAGLCVAAIALVKDVKLRRGRWVIVPAVLALLILPTQRTIAPARLVAHLSPSRDVPSGLKAAGASLPPNAVIFLPKPAARLRNELMFYLDRSTYVLPDDPNETADLFKEAREAGGDVWVYDAERAGGGNPFVHR